MSITCVLLACPALADAQAVRGRLIESGTSDPIPLGSVALVDTASRIVDQTVTNEDGLFDLRSPASGRFFIVAEKLGFRRAVDGPLDLSTQEAIAIDFLLIAEPFRMDSLVVLAERRRTDRFLDSQGFYERKSAGFGHFLTPDQIAQRPPALSLELLMQPLSLGITWHRTPFGRVLMVKGTTGPCDPAIYVDGIVVGSARGGSGSNVLPPTFVLDDVVSPEQVAGIEIYNRISSMPLQYQGTNGCGVVLIWTKH